MNNGEAYFDVVINTSVQLYAAGQRQSGPKFKFVSSHTGRRSFATNLARTAESLEQAKDMIARFVGPLDVARDTGLVHPRRLVWYTIEADDEVVYKSMDYIL